MSEPAAAIAPARPASPPLIVFDWDGTLMDSIGNMVDCALEAFADAQLPAPPAATIRDAIGLGLDEVAAHILPSGEKSARTRLIGRYRSLWMDVYRHRVALYGGVPETLATLAGRGHVLAIATGRSRRGLDHDLEATGLAPRFAATLTADEAPSKPHPQMLLDVLGALDMPPQAALMVGDTTYDLEMARRAGVGAIGVLYGSHHRDALAAFAPLALIEAIAELPDILAGAASGAAPAQP